MTLLRITSCLALGLLLHTAGKANNIQIANSTLTGNTGTSVQVQFDLSWENSWRGGAVTNWDAAWVFVKYRTSLAGPWLHANLNNAGHVAAAGSQIDLGLLNPGGAYNPSSNPVVGVFVYRNASGTGNLSLLGTQLQWNFAAQGLNYADVAQVRVFAVEMVYVPQGGYAVGSGGTEISAFTLTTINTANATTASGGMGTLGGQAGGYPTGQTAPSNANWPNGFNAFYCMKYEVTQQSYVDFLNSLSYIQQMARTATAPNFAAGTGALSSTNANRNGIDIEAPGVSSGTPAVYACNLNGNGLYGETNDGTDIACNWLSWGDLSAYLDWSGLRPMTELEYEKACRGTIAPVANEYAWGSTGIAFNSYTLLNAATTDEGIATNYSTTLGNANWGSGVSLIDGPMRVGIFAANGSNSGRVTGGASYYGIMELGGNLYERVVSIGSPSGRAYTGTHGNGAVLAGGDQDVANWPAPTTADGAGFRGGSWTHDTPYHRVSDRFLATGTYSIRFNYVGGRGVRFAP
ncbi:MAG: SUMF1/EgtB/PvdO family nonheme iron enzyme [Flavobacteriales bacterium]|nr:SUMF1/EgtB/PvdO family nonheme iron enzyme [Flavobacteriales bacterium]MBP6698727.1 SUMF1/EgtB/PvdO family nonheme iron enzyme [Flavobacteriales bacterium]